MMNRRVFFTLSGLALVSAGVGEEILFRFGSMSLLAGAGFGWLFWKYGLESAIAAHFNYDRVLFYGIVPVL